jgi:hypothetical protein
MAKAAYLRHYRMLGNQIPAREPLLHGTSTVFVFSDSGTYLSLPNKVGSIFYDSDAGELFFIKVTNGASPFPDFGTRSTYSRLLVISHYKTPADYTEGNHNVVAGGVLGDSACTNVILRQYQIDFVFGASNSSGVHLPSVAWGKETVEFEKLYVEFDITNLTTSGYVTKVLLDADDGRGLIDYTNSLVEGGVLFYKNSGPNTRGRIVPVNCDMYVNISKVWQA